MNLTNILLVEFRAIRIPLKLNIMQSLVKTININYYRFKSKFSAYHDVKRTLITIIVCSIIKSQFRRLSIKHQRYVWYKILFNFVRIIILVSLKRKTGLVRIVRLSATWLISNYSNYIRASGVPGELIRYNTLHTIMCTVLLVCQNNGVAARTWSFRLLRSTRSTMSSVLEGFLSSAIIYSVHVSLTARFSRVLEL